MLLSSILKAPWQVGLAVGATFLVAAEYIEEALSHLFTLTGSDTLLQANEAAVAHRYPAYDSVLAFEKFEHLSAETFFVVGIAVLLMGIFLWVGAFRVGVRGILTVTMVVTFAGSLFTVIRSFETENGIDVVGIFEVQLINTVALILVLLLWGKAGKKWVAIGAKKKWDQE
ncbi:unannotated protein [freshwater metagenome]|uniref:Unannotated protein n=1 Tax=freshwater metagenome TaxID=449393 RepID=A0A6J7FV81_9ZZZZ